jgi:hypothetical protein
MLGSKAANTESHARVDKEGSRHQHIHHFLRPELLEEVWEVIMHTVEEDGLRDFRDIKVFFSGKNLKVLTKRPTLQGVWDNFFGRWDDAIDANFLDPDQVWLDVGKEVCAPPSFLWYQDAGDQKAETYLWRPCCLDAYWQWSLHGSSPRQSLRSTYQTAFLRDAVGMTLLSGRRSPSRQQGLIYSQFYTSQKEIFDAAKKFPFQDGALESLALDPKIRAGWQHAGGSQNHRPETLEKSYLGSKARCASGITGSMQKSFGTREEHRMTLTLARRLRDRLMDQGAWGREVPPSGPLPFWRIPTVTFLEVMRANINKFTTGFEYVRSLGTKGFISWEHSQAMIMFLRLLRFGSGSHQLAREIAVWWDERRSRRTGKQYYGLGFSTTVGRYGYGWLLPKIDWERFTFFEDLPGRSLFGNVPMAEAFKARWRAVREIKDDFVKVETLGRLLQRYQSSEDAQDVLLNHMVWTCIRHFRKDVFSSIRGDIRPEYRAAAIEGQFPLCKANLDKILTPGSESSDDVPRYRLASGNKMAFKELGSFVDFLWDFDDGQERKHWAQKGYRVLYERCIQIISDCCGQRTAELFTCRIKERFPLSNWIVPYPNRTVFWQHTKGHERMWLSIYQKRLDGAIEPGAAIRWTDLYKAQEGGIWEIGRTAFAVLQAIPQEPRGIVSKGMDEVKAQVERKWESYQRTQAGQEGRTPS